jgi:hypothetical protein
MDWQKWRNAFQAKYNSRAPMGLLLLPSKFLW